MHVVGGQAQARIGPHPGVLLLAAVIGALLVAGPAVGAARGARAPADASDAVAGAAASRPVGSPVVDQAVPDEPVTGALPRLADDALEEGYDVLREEIAEICQHEPIGSAPGGMAAGLLLPLGSLEDLGYADRAGYRPIGITDVPRIARTGSSAQDLDRLRLLGAVRGWERLLRGPAGRIDVALLVFGNERQACAFAELDYALAVATSDSDPVPAAIPGGWVATEYEAVHLHFRIGELVYLLTADPGVPIDVLTEIATRQLDQVAW